MCICGKKTRFKNIISNVSAAHYDLDCCKNETLISIPYEIKTVVIVHL